MYKTLTLLFLSLCSSAYAIDNAIDKRQDEIDFQVSAKQWVTTQTAQLTISLNATLTNSDLVQARHSIMEKLSKIAEGDWHLTQFDRSQDGSGLEKLTVSAEARVQQASLTRVYQNVKSVSKPGETYQVNAIEFKPSFDEIQQARVQLREALYQQAREELARINKIYDKQQFSLNRLVFVDPQASEPMAKIRANVMLASPMPQNDSVMVSNELIMTAIVQVAANGH